MPHTPGPYQLIEARRPMGNGIWPVYVGDANGRKIANCFGDTNEREANARLFVAAPDLLRLLKRYRAETPLGNQPHMIGAEADQIIARAEGRDE